MIAKEVDLVVIGGGAAGMAAAIKASESGLKNVIVLERAEAPGGLLQQCIHNGFGIHYFNEDLTGPEYAERFIERLSSMNIRLALNTMVTHLYPDRSVIAINSDWGEFRVLPRAVILAMGCREKTRPQIAIPGTRPAGIFTAGLAQRLVNIDGYLPGKEIVILGSGDVGMIMARRLHLEGCNVKAVVEVMSYTGGLIRNKVQCLHDFNIPLLLEHAVTEIYGNHRVRGVKIARVDKAQNIIINSECSISCDCLLISAGLIPENELSKEAGIQLDELTDGPVVDEFLQTSIDGIFAAGNVLQTWDLVDNVTLDGEKAGKNAARYVDGELMKSPNEIKVIAGENIKSLTPQKIIGFEDIELVIRVQQPIEGAELIVGNKRKRYKVITHSEVIKVNIKASSLETLRKKGRVKISCFKR